MKLSVSSKVLGVLLMTFSLTMLPPLAVSYIYHEDIHYPFFITFLITLFFGLVLWLPVKNKKHTLRNRDGFMIGFLFWWALGAVAALPFIFSPLPNIPLVDAVFEAVSGLTTTGATVLAQLDSYPKSILYYRQQLQFLGGMGILVLAIAILPMLGIGGMQLYRAESSSHVKDNKLTPRLTETAKALWLIYVSFTVLCCIAYYLSGMTFFDAVCYSFSTVSTGGFAPHDANFGFYPQTSIKLIAMFFMLLSAISFSLHFTAFHVKKVSHYFHDSELRFYLRWVFAVTGLLFFAHVYPRHAFSPDSTPMEIIFQAFSFATSTGFTSTDYITWPHFTPYLLLLIGTFAGCAGSTSGGIKMMRVQVLLKQSAHEIKRLIHPSGHFILKIGKIPLSGETVESIWAFVTMFLLIFIILVFMLLWTGVNLPTAITTANAALANLGPAFGDAYTHFATLPNQSKWILSAAMLLGRLELFTVLVLFSRTFWRD